MKDNDSTSLGLIAIYAILFAIAMGQCTHNEKVERSLDDIRHEITMLKYK